MKQQMRGSQEQVSAQVWSHQEQVSAQVWRHREQVSVQVWEGAPVTLPAASTPVHVCTLSTALGTSPYFMLLGRVSGNNHFRS